MHDDGCDGFIVTGCRCNFQLEAVVALMILARVLALRASPAVPWREKVIFQMTP